MIPSTRDRVPRHTHPKRNRTIRQETRDRVARLRSATSSQIEGRLKALDREWDIERALEANASTLILLGTALGALVNRRFFLVPAVVSAFLLQHAFQGWCPPVPLLRRWGMRTSYEIDEERYALKALRGDFARLNESDPPLIHRRPSADEVLRVVQS